MKEIKSLDKIYLKDFDVYVNQYLTYAQIQQIINAIMKFDTWSERQQNIELLVLYHATNMGQTNIEKMGHDLLLQSGLIDQVKLIIKNFNQIQEGIEYTQSLPRALKQISDNIPGFKKIVQEAVITHGRSNNK